MASPTESPLTPLGAKTACRRHGVAGQPVEGRAVHQAARMPPPAAATSTSGSTCTAPAAAAPARRRTWSADRPATARGRWPAWRHSRRGPASRLADEATAGGRRLSCSAEAVSSTAPVSAMIRIREMTVVLLSRSNAKTGQRFAALDQVCQHGEADGQCAERDHRGGEHAQPVGGRERYKDQQQVRDDERDGEAREWPPRRTAAAVVVFLVTGSPEPGHAPIEPVERYVWSKRGEYFSTHPRATTQGRAVTAKPTATAAMHAEL